VRLCHFSSDNAVLRRKSLGTKDNSVASGIPAIDLSQRRF
jgi:hypothetical protein